MNRNDQFSNSSDEDRLIRDLAFGSLDEKCIAAYQLGEIAPPSPSVGPALFGVASTTQDERLRTEACYSIVKMKEKGIEFLLEGLESQNAEVSSTFVAGLKSYGGPWAAIAVPRLLELLTSSPKEVVVDIVCALTAVGPQSNKLIYKIASLINCDFDVNIACLHAIKSLLLVLPPFVAEKLINLAMREKNLIRSISIRMLDDFNYLATEQQINNIISLIDTKNNDDCFNSLINLVIRYFKSNKHIHPESLLLGLIPKYLIGDICRRVAN